MANSITLTISQITASAASDPSLCRVSGYLRDIHGNVLVGEKLVVRHKYDPAVVGSDTIILSEYQEVLSDDNGQVEFDLYRGATVDIELPNRTMDLVREALVPDVASIDLVDLAFPRLASVAWDDTSPVAASVDERFDLTVTGTITDGSTLDVTGDCTYVIDDETILQDMGGGSFLALLAGTTTVAVTEVDTDGMEIYQEPDGDVIARLDTPAITFPADITVNVT